MDSESVRFGEKRVKKNIMAPYLIFYNVCCVFRMATTTVLPPCVCLGDSRAADGASIHLLPWGTDT